MTTPAPTSDPTGTSGTGAVINTAPAIPAALVNPPPAPQTFTQEALDAILKDRLAQQQRQHESKIALATKAAEDAKATQDGDFRKLAESAVAARDEAVAKFAAREHHDRQVAAAKAAGLPEAMAARLHGDDDKALEADAKALAALLPAPATAEPAVAAAARPGGNKPGPKPASPDVGADVENQMRATGRYNAF